MPYSKEIGYLSKMAEDGIDFQDSRLDAVEKLRVSNPQSLIDTDFEYSLQASKWEFLTLCNNYPGVYSRANEPAFTANQIVSIVPSGVDNKDVTVTTNILPTLPFKVGDSIVLKETAETTYVDGAYIISQVLSEYSFVVTTKAPANFLTLPDYKTPYTAIFTGGFYTNSNIPIIGVSAIAGTKAALIQFANPHGIFINTPITVTDGSQSAVPWCGSFTVSSIPSDTHIIYQTLTGQNFSSNTLLVPSSGGVYGRTEGVVVHRFFDGGVQINPGTSAPDARIMRQTRKYFKYQSGKSMQYSTGVLFRPVYEVTNAYIDKTNYLNSIYLSAVNIVSEGSGTLGDINGVYTRPPSSSFFTTFTTNPFNNTISYNTLSSFWELYSEPDAAVVARNTSIELNPLQWEVLSNFETSFAPLTATTNIKALPTHPYYDFVISTEQYHGFADPDTYRQGATIRTLGFEITGTATRNPYNNTFTVNKVLNSKTFSVQIPVNPQFNPFPTTDFSPGGIANLEVVGWNDATVRSGLFDDQNGMFFEYDGKQFWAVKRQTTTPLAGTVDVKLGSPWLVSTDGSTKFLSQLKENDFINIKGISYQVNSIISNLSAVVTPVYKGPNANNLKVIKTEEIRIPQSEFNLDRLDGTGPSKYNLNLNRMQMMFIDYSWYGAGKIRYGIRANKGKIIYFHEIYNNNVNTKAHMRSGNLPGRFEIQSKSQTGTFLTSVGSTGVSSTSARISNDDANYLPIRGRIVVDNEYIEYTKGSSNSSGTILTFNKRNAGGLTSGAKSFSIGSSYKSVNQNCSPALSHWGVAALMDGNFNEDRSYLFTSTTHTFLSATSAEQALISVRLAPSVDYGITGLIGERNLINHSLLKLQNIGVLTNNPLEIIVRVNSEPQIIFKNLSAWRSTDNGSIAQYYDHTIDGTFEIEGTGGDKIASFYITPDIEYNGYNNPRFISQDYNIDVVRELTNSILGGDFVYPDGPDVVTIGVKTLNNYSAVCRGRISWTEDQG
jgi:hypothetical protein